MPNKAYTEKIMVLGVDGMDPKLTKKYVDMGIMPSVKKFIEAGAQREDLVLLGSQPTVTPPQWTTLATGANPVVHGITQFSRIVPGFLTQQGYNVDSRLCKAEPAWNCTAEAGIKTLVLHWPGSAWPPTSDSENLYVIDGATPGSVGCASMQRDNEVIIGASVEFTETTFVARKITDAAEPCVIKKLPDENLIAMDMAANLKSSTQLDENMAAQLTAGGIETVNVIFADDDGFGTRAGDLVQNLATAMSPIKDAKGWVNAPADAKEFTVLLSGGLVRRVGLILPNEQGIYDTVAIYKSKKETLPLATCPLGEMVYNVMDDVIEEDTTYLASRHYKLMSIEPDGSKLSLYVSSAIDTVTDSVIHPKRLHKALLENVGPFPPQSVLYSQDPALQTAMLEVWEKVADWYADTIEYMTSEEDIKVIFSHLHSIDLITHTFIRHMENIGFNDHDESVYEEWMQNVYKQIDRYFEKMLHYLDEDWTVIITSDHALVGPKHIPPQIGDMAGINAGLLEELGYTVLVRDENGNRTKKVDWSKTRAVASQGNDIFINLKGREPKGIVDPEDKYALEEQIITDLYGYKHPDTGQRVIALALHNKDAVLLGYGGPLAGDVCFWTAEGYNYDHTDSLSTAHGAGDTSSSPIFIAAGKGLKQSYTTSRWIRQVDLAPTMCVMLGVRIPSQCEGAPIYQILEDFQA